MEPFEGLPLQVKGDIKIMVMKEYLTFPKAQKVEPRY